MAPLEPGTNPSDSDAPLPVRSRRLRDLGWALLLALLVSVMVVLSNREYVQSVCYDACWAAGYRNAESTAIAREAGLSYRCYCKGPDGADVRKMSLIPHRWSQSRWSKER